MKCLSRSTDQTVKYHAADKNHTRGEKAQARQVRTFKKYQKIKTREETNILLRVHINRGIVTGSHKC